MWQQLLMMPFPFRWLIYFLRNQFTSFWSIWWTKKYISALLRNHIKNVNDITNLNRIGTGTFHFFNLRVNLPVVNVGFFMFVTDNQSARNYCFHYFLVSLWWPSFYCFTVRKVGILVYDTHSVYSVRTVRST